MTYPSNSYTNRDSPTLYSIECTAYYERAMNLFTKFRMHSLENLYYSALETRCCIERLLYEYIALLNPDTINKTKIDSTWKPKDLKHLILDIEPRFYKTAGFLKILFSIYKIPGEPKTPNLELLSKCYGVIGQYLHAPRVKTEQHTTKAGIETLAHHTSTALIHILEILEEPRATIEFSATGKHFFAIYCTGFFSDEAIRLNMTRVLQKQTSGLPA